MNAGWYAQEMSEEVLSFKLVRGLYWVSEPRWPSCCPENWQGTFSNSGTVQWNLMKTVMAEKPF